MSDRPANGCRHSHARSNLPDDKHRSRQTAASIHVDSRVMIIGPAVALVLWLVSITAQFVMAEQVVPRLLSRVNDHAKILHDSSEVQIEALLKRHEDATTNQIAILTIDTLDGEPIESFSLRVAQTWKLGVSGKDNGVLLMVSRKDRQMRIEVGYGLEPVLNDARAGRIIQNTIAPAFRRNDYAEGLAEGAKRDTNAAAY